MERMRNNTCIVFFHCVGKQRSEKSRFPGEIFIENRDKIRGDGRGRKRNKKASRRISVLGEIPGDRTGARSCRWGNYLRISRDQTAWLGYSVIFDSGAKLENLRGPWGGERGAFENSVGRSFARYSMLDAGCWAGARRFPSFPSNRENLPLRRRCRASRDFSNFHYASQRDLPRASGMHNTRNKNDDRINIDRARSCLRSTVASLANFLSIFHQTLG